MPHYCNRYIALYRKGLFGIGLRDTGLLLMIPAQKITWDRKSFTRLDGVPVIFDIATNETIIELDGYYDGGEEVSDGKNFTAPLADDTQKKVISSLEKLGLIVK